MAFSSSDIAAIRAAGAALAEAFQDPDATAWVSRYTEDPIFAGPGVPPIEGGAASLAPGEQTAISVAVGRR